MPQMIDSLVKFFKPERRRKVTADLEERNRDLLRKLDEVTHERDVYRKKFRFERTNSQRLLRQVKRMKKGRE